MTGAMFALIVVTALVSAGLAALITWLLLKGRTASEGQRARAEFADQLGSESRARAVAEERASRIPALEGQVRDREKDLSAAQSRSAELAAQLEAERKQSAEKVTLLLQAKDELSLQFQNLAQKIFEEKGDSFVRKNRESLDELLKPFNKELKEFKIQVDKVYTDEAKERFSLQNEIKRLVELNNRISQDAVNLTKALKGDGKTQGSWGELVLERVLESSGLQKGREYEIQESFEKDEGGKARPDVLVKLPEGKHIIIDSKVSLTAYEDYCSAEVDDVRLDALSRHLASVRSHISGLSGKNYQSLYGIRSLDFVLLFMPVEPSFMLAVQSDRNLYMDAFRKNIMIVGPWNLLISLKTISSIWRYEYQNRNAQELARQCGALYDKFVGFVTDLEEVGKKIDAARGSFDSAYGKLSSGKGNLIRQVERIRQLGVKPAKLLPAPLVELAEDGEAEDEPTSESTSKL